MTKVLGVEFAPLDVPLVRRLQTAAVLYWTWSFLFKGVTGTILTFYVLLFTQFWYLSVLYLVWFWLDHKTCERGGRRSAWIRSWPLWNYLRDYFPVTLVKTADLDPNKNYVCGYHPHGIFCAGAFTSFCTEAVDFVNKFPNIRPSVLTLQGQFQFPLYREFVLATGACSVSRNSLHWLLTNQGKGNMAIIVIGGAREVLNTGFGPDVRLVLRKRKGFVRTALTHGASLLPIFAFGENELYAQPSNPEGSLLRRIQDLVTTYVGIPPLIVFGRGIFQYNFGILPFRNPVSVVVGKPIEVEKIENPSEAEINHYHNLYIESLTKLFDEHKINYDYYKTAKLIV